MTATIEGPGPAPDSPVFAAVADEARLALPSTADKAIRQASDDPRVATLQAQNASAR